MSRYFSDWLQGYIEYTKFSEAPTNFHFFTGVSTIAAVLQRKVWYEMGYFRWYPNFYVIFVAKPGIATKSTSLDLGSDLLRSIPGVYLGPSSATWQALVQRLSEVSEQVEIDGEFYPMSCLTFSVSELGTLIDFRNRELIDVLVDLWDGKTRAWEKMSKMHGTESVANPWINIITGVTPSWLADNVPEAAVGGGFTSRCLFVYGTKKRQLSAYPARHFTRAHMEVKERLIADLSEISQMKGPFSLTEEAMEYGEVWYKNLWENPPIHLTAPRFEGYMSRKQTHLHKLMMALSAAKSNDRVLTLEHFQVAEKLLDSLENDMTLALDKVGRHEASVTLELFLDYLDTAHSVSYVDAIRFLSRYGDFNAVKNVINTATSAGLIKQVQTGSTITLRKCR